MRKTLAKLQDQHPTVKTRVALSVATGVTGVIGLVILTTLPLRFQGSTVVGGSANTASVITATGEAVAPHITNLQNSWNTVTGLEVTQGGEAQSSSQLPEQDISQDATFPSDSAELNTETY